MNIELSLDKTRIKAGDIVEIKWACENADSVQLSINNGYKEVVTDVPMFGSKKIRLNRSKGKTKITLIAIVGGEKIIKSEEVKVKKRWFEEDENQVITEESNEENFDNEELPWWRTIIHYTTLLLLAIPIFPLVLRLIPSLNWAAGFDRIIEFCVLVVIIELVLRIRPWFDIAAFGIMLTILTLGSIKGNGYGFRQMAQDYKVFRNSYLNKNKMVKSEYKYNPVTPQKTKKQNFTIRDSRTEERNRIKNAADYTNSIVRNFATQQVTMEPFATQGKYQHSDDIMNIIHAFAVFKTINQNWKYVHDPRGFDYNSKASETIQNRANGKFTGDCDDHAIVMAASVAAVGAKARIVLSCDTRTHERHAYPELWLGSRYNAETTYYLIGELFPNYYDRDFYYRIDNNGDYWLNLDYTESYPGGRFLQDSVEYVINIP